jgi:hypothetical protein
MTGEPTQPEFNEYASNYEAVINDYVGVFGQPQEFYTRAKADHLRHILDAKGGGRNHLRCSTSDADMA